MLSIPSSLAALTVLTLASALVAADRPVAPSFLRRHLPDVAPRASAFMSDSASYKPLFGEGDDVAWIVKSVSRFGELTVAPAGASLPASFAREEHVVVVLEGAGKVAYAGTRHALRRHDYFYVPPGVTFSLQGGASQPLRAIVMGFRIPGSEPVSAPPGLLLANIDDVPKQVVGNHPPSTLYRLLMGDTRSTRDRLAAGHVMKSLFVMEFAPGGTNFPHHHEREEEIYLLLDGEGEMVAGGGLDGIEGRFPAKPGDAYFYRLNTTVGFYNGARPARILAVRSSFPFAVK